MGFVRNMKIIFSEEHVSIKRFDPISLPDFVVLTGMNGAGKSHLLEAIQQKKVLVEGHESDTPVYFDYRNFSLENEGVFGSLQLIEEKKQAWRQFNESLKFEIRDIRNEFKGDNYSTLLNICAAKGKNLWDLQEEDFEEFGLYKEYRSYKERIDSVFRSKDAYKNSDWAKGVHLLLKRLPYAIDDIEEEDFLVLYKAFNFKNDFLPIQLGKIMWDYFVKLDDNEYKKFENETKGTDNAVLTDAEFIKIHGEKPWVLISSILDKFRSLDFTINNPEGLSRGDNFQFKLTQASGSAEVNFDRLSSGEKVLMALVASAYKLSSDNHFPNVLLLDEIDASLHPSMVKNLLEVLNEIFLERGTKVILVTHSPTTIAFAPEESIYVMSKAGGNRLNKRTREEALAILTEGFATLEKGIKLFDEVSRTEIALITEGNNTVYLKKLLELKGLTNIEIVEGVESISSKSQLKTIFDFFARVPHEKKVVFVWDCDATSMRALLEKNLTYPFVFKKNASNILASGGIENLFDITLFDDFKKVITLANGQTSESFDQNEKRRFELFIARRNQLQDFDKFEELIEYINSIQ